MIEENSRDDSISVYQLFDLLNLYKWLISGLVLLGAVSAYVFVSVFLHPVWEATAIVEIGHVAGSIDPKDQVEPTQNVVSRMLHPSFYRSSLPFAALKPEEYDLGSYELSTLKATQVKGSELVEIKLRAHSSEAAERLLRASFSNLKKLHEIRAAELVEAIRGQNKQQLELIGKKLQEAAIEGASLRKRLFANNNWNSFDATLAATVLQNNAAEVFRLSQVKAEIEQRMDASRITPTAIVGSIYVSDGPVSPKVKLFVAVGGLAGLILALLIAWIRHMVVNRPARDLQI